MDGEITEGKFGERAFIYPDTAFIRWKRLILLIFTFLNLLYISSFRQEAPPVVMCFLEHIADLYSVLFDAVTW